MPFQTSPWILTLSWKKEVVYAMAERRGRSTTGRQMRRAGAEELQEAQAAEAGSAFEWHFGRVTRLGYFEVGGGRSVTILWEEGGITSQQGDVSEAQWEIFRLAFLTSGRIAVLSNQQAEHWMYDYRMLEAVR
jgi:hypothetical protein